MIFTMAAAGAVIKKIPWTVYAVIGLLLFIWWWGQHQYNKGQKDVQDKWTASIARGKVIVDELKKKQIITTKVYVDRYIDRVKVIKEKGKTIYEQVPYYVPEGTPDLPYTVGLHHDSAATNTIPGTPEGADGTAWPVVDFARTVATNYETYHVTAARLVNLQDWVTEQRENYLAACKQPDARCN